MPTARHQRSVIVHQAMSRARRKAGSTQTGQMGPRPEPMLFATALGYFPRDVHLSVHLKGYRQGLGTLSSQVKPRREEGCPHLPPPCKASGRVEVVPTQCYMPPGHLWLALTGPGLIPDPRGS